MQIFNRGTWSRYTPNPFPAGLPTNTLFAKRDTDGFDWYAALYSNTPLFQAGSIAVTAYQENGQWKTQAVDSDPTKVFPLGGLLLEITGYTGTDAFADLHGKKYDPVTNTLSDFPAAPVTSVTPRQIRLALTQIGLRQQIEDYVNAQDITVKDNWNYASEFLRDNALLNGAATALGKTSADIDALFALAATL